MTISNALNSALSGLRAAGRGAEVVSSNISNALTPGYGRRILDLSSDSIGTAGGVRIDGITRVVDASLAQDRRLAEAEQLNTKAAADFYAQIGKLLGTPDDPSSLAARLSGFENALITASSRPDAPERLSTVVSEANSLAASLSDASAGIQEARSNADRTIGDQVERLNTLLEQVATLNTQITATEVQGGDVAALQDLRQRTVDELGTLVPVRQVPRDNGQIALYSTGGAVLLDGTPATIGFDTSNVVTPYMSLAASTLSGLTINDNPVRTDSEKGVLRGGTIGALFAIRDEMGIAAQEQVDAIARDLVDRFQSPTVDPTLAIGDPGLFTDNGGAFDPVDELGLSSRLELNAAVDPDQGGEVWRIRDGMNAVTPGAASDATILQSLTSVLSDTRPVLSGGFASVSFTASGLVSAVASGLNTSRSTAEQQFTFATARLTEMTERQLADGVDSDAEFSRLILIEQNYAANARMIQTVDEMMETLLRL